jgi:glucose-1-phosphate thymidylyltransferase
MTSFTNKQLLTIYDKPMINYPISTLMMAGIRDILIISSAEYIDQYKKYFGDGKHLGMDFSYIVQPEPKGLAQAFTLGKDFIGEDDVMMILGDNIFCSEKMGDHLAKAVENAKNHRATVFAYEVEDPERFGVVEFDENGKAISIEEKPAEPKSNYAVVGLYAYDKSVIDIASNIEPSARGEYEITTVNEEYLKRGLLDVVIFESGAHWLDTGIPETMLDAANFVFGEQKRTNRYAGCFEEIAYLNGWVSAEQLTNYFISQGRNKSAYDNYVLGVEKRNEVLMKVLKSKRK